jgi:CBS-domain-containing membrane protein
LGNSINTLLGQVNRREVLRVVTQELLLLTDSWRDSVRDYENSHEEYCNIPVKERLMVSTFMNKKPQTITENTDFLSMAQIFLNTNNRRLPVLSEGKLIGQISRRDLLKAVYKLTTAAPDHKPSMLYVSGLMQSDDAPFEGSKWRRRE